MAAGNFPSTGALSVLDISEGYYGTPTPVCGLLSMGNSTLSLSAPYSVLDFRGLSYCCVKPSITSILWSPSQSGSGVACAVSLEINPDMTFAVFSTVPLWLCAILNQSTNQICIYPKTTNPTNDRTSRICLCSTTNSYVTSYINVTQQGDGLVT